ncbi:MAG: phosphoglucosamine mutase [Candidatus Micrarchaeota archaeon]
MTAKYFGTNGIRGKFDFLNEEFALKAAIAIGTYFNNGKIVVGRDVRLTGERLNNAVLAGLTSIGCEVIDLGVVTSPTAEFMIKKLNADGLIIITASHLPPEYNALKVVDRDGVSVSRERGEDIEKLMLTNKNTNYKNVKPVLKYKNATSDHITAMIKLIGKNIEKIKSKKYKVAVDCANATMCLIAPYVLRDLLGCQIISINSQIDGTFPGRDSEPTKENIKELISIVKATKCDLGIAFDCDGDRVTLVDENGEFVIGDKITALSFLIKLQEKKGSVVTTVATSKATQDVAEKFGVKTIYTKVGAPYICEAVLENKCVSGGEEVGGVIWPELSLAKDGIFTAVKIIEHMALTGKKLSEAIAQVPVYYNHKIKISAKSDEKQTMLKKAKAYATKKKLKINEIDGIRVDFADSWVIVRASGTEDYVRIFAEAKTQEKAQQLVNEYEQIVKAQY